MHRRHVHKGRSARRFRHHLRRTKRINVGAPMRGGWRL